MKVLERIWADLPSSSRSVANIKNQNLHLRMVQVILKFGELLRLVARLAKGCIGNAIGLKGPLDVFHQVGKLDEKQDLFLVRNVVDQTNHVFQLFPIVRSSAGTILLNIEFQGLGYLVIMIVDGLTIKRKTFCLGVFSTAIFNTSLRRPTMYTLAPTSTTACAQNQPRYASL